MLRALLGLLGKLLCFWSPHGELFLQDKRKRPAPRPDVQLMPQSENRLRRETPYVCNVRFHADLPEVGCAEWLPPAARGLPRNTPESLGVLCRCHAIPRC